MQYQFTLASATWRSCHTWCKWGMQKTRSWLRLVKKFSNTIWKEWSKITAEYLPGSWNVEAGTESRQTKDSSKWKLNSTIITKLCQIRETPARWIFLPWGCHTIYPTTCPGKSTLSVRARMYFRYLGIASLCMIFPLLLS